MESQLRKYKDNLITAGRVIIVFQLWALAKVFLSWFAGFGKSTTTEQAINATSNVVAETSNSIDATLKLVVIITALIIVGVFLFDLFGRIYVGRTALKIGRGQKKGNRRYIVVAFILLLISLIGDAVSFISLIHATFDIVTLFSFVVELTSLYALIDLIHSALKVNKLSKLLSE